MHCTPPPEEGYNCFGDDAWDSMGSCGGSYGNKPDPFPVRAVSSGECSLVAANPPVLHSVMIVDGNVRVEYSKDFETCAHLDRTSPYQITHIHNLFCTSGDHVVEINPLSEFHDLAVGDEVVLTHGNLNLFSDPVTVTYGGGCACASECSGTSGLVTVDFEAVIDAGNSNVLLSEGDILFGSYTYDPTAAVLPYPPGDTSVEAQSVCMYPALPGTGFAWELHFSNPGIAGTMWFEGSWGVITYGNDMASWFGKDRYIVTLDHNITINWLVPPNLDTVRNLYIDFLQLDFQGEGDMLSSDSYVCPPDLSRVQGSHGRLKIEGDTGGCTSCQLTVTSLRLR